MHPKTSATQNGSYQQPQLNHEYLGVNPLVNCQVAHSHSREYHLRWQILNISVAAGPK